LQRFRGMLDPREGSLLFIGTATVLVRFAGFTVLTDPNFLHRHEVVRLGYGLRSRRLTEPAMQIEQLPGLDLIVLSHFHEDHFDRVAEARLDRELPIFSTPHATEKLARRGFADARALTTWQSRRIQKGPYRLDVTAMPGRHGPAVFSALLPPVMGSMLDFSTVAGERLLRLYISGDTLVYEALHDIPRRYPGVDLALLHLGGTRAFGVLVTMDGRQGVEAMRIVDPKVAIPIHYDDYDVFESPLEDFQHEVRRAGLEDRVHYLAHGDEYRFSVPARLETQPHA
jgi:L-ascorbate metabolism protein UlaG (beta-lactamase superfamily)